MRLVSYVRTIIIGNRVFYPPRRYSNGDWCTVDDVSGEYIEDHTSPPTQKIWLTPLMKFRSGEYPYAGLYEVAVIVSNDSDLMEPIKIVRNELKLPVIVLNYFSTHPATIAEICDIYQTHPLRCTFYQPVPAEGEK